MSAPRVTVVVVTYQGRAHLEPCLHALAEVDYPADALDVVVVDNGSTDGSRELVRERFPAVRWIESGANNYCRANNLAIAASDAPYVALLNNDTRVARGWLTPLVAALEADVGLAGVGSVILTGGAVTGAGHVRQPNFYWEDRRALPAGRPGEGPAFAVDSLSGCSALYRRRALDEVGGLDEAFVMYVEDVDLALRLAAKGWRLACVPDSVVDHVHHGTATEAQAHAFSERNRLLLLAKHFPGELPAALFGRGYFAVGAAGAGEIHAVMADVIAMLITHHGTQEIIDLLPPLFTSLARVTMGAGDVALERFARQTTHIAGLDEEIARRDAALAAKDAHAAGLVAEIEARDRLVAAKDAHAASLMAEIEARDRLVTDKDAHADHLRAEIERRDRMLADKDAYAVHLRAEIERRDRMIADKDDYADHLRAQIALHEG